MVRSFALVLIPSVVGLAACSGASAGTEFGTGDIVAIRQQSERFAAAFNDKDVPAVVSTYLGTATFMPPNSSLLRGRDSVRGFYETMLEEDAVDLELSITDIAGHGPLAYQSGSYVMTLRPADGQGATRDRGKYLFVLRRINGQWLYEYAIWNSDLPEPVAIGT